MAKTIHSSRVTQMQLYPLVTRLDNISGPLSGLYFWAPMGSHSEKIPTPVDLARTPLRMALVTCQELETLSF